MQITHKDSRSAGTIIFFTSIHDADSIDNGFPITYDNEKALAIYEKDKQGKSLYLIKVTSGFNKVFNPYGLITDHGNYVLYKMWSQNHKFKFKATTKDIFENYIEFLKTKNHVYFLLAEIKHLNYEIPNIEILQWCKGF